MLNKPILNHNRNGAITIGGKTMNAGSIRTFDQAILSAWQDELKATRNPSIKQQCLQRESELLLRFAEH
jgi:hypothetical protein